MLQHEAVNLALAMHLHPLSMHATASVFSATCRARVSLEDLSHPDADAAAIAVAEVVVRAVRDAGGEDTTASSATKRVELAKKLDDGAQDAGCSMVQNERLHASLLMPRRPVPACLATGLDMSRERACWTKPSSYNTRRISSIDCAAASTQRPVSAWIRNPQDQR